MELMNFCGWWQRRGVRRTLVALIGGAVLFVAVNGTRRALFGSSEFRAFRRIVQVSLVQDQDHYKAIPHVRAYPPFFAIFWSPFGVFPVGAMAEPDTMTIGQRLQLAVSAAAVVLLMTAFTFWSVRCIVAAVQPAAEEGERSCLTPLVWMLAGGLMLNSVVRVETDMFVVMLVAGGMYLIFARARNWEGGALLGVAAALKLTPLLFVVYLLCRRNWRGAAGMVLAGIVCTIVLPLMVWGFQGSYQRTRSWVEHVVVPVASGGPEFIDRAYRSTNQSLRAAAVRYLTRYNAGTSAYPAFVNVVDMSEQTVRRIVNVLRLIILGLLVAAWALPGAHADRELELLLFALVPLGMLLLSDVSVGGHFAIAVVPLGVLTAHCFRHAGEPLARRLSWWVLAGFVLMSLMGVRTLKELSVATAGAVLLYVVCLQLAWRLHRDSAAHCPAA